MRGGKAETSVRVYLDIENREGELFALVTAPDEQQHTERPSRVTPCASRPFPAIRNP
jgi:hypothetical protein